MELPPTFAAGAVRPARLSETARQPGHSDAEIRATAEAFEATYLAEMLKNTGLNETPAGFGGGAGEDGFASFLTEEYSRLISARGGIGLAERIFDVLKQGKAR